MKKFITGMFLLMSLHGWGQIDTVFLSQEKLADTIYNGLYTKCPTGFLANKLSLLPSDSTLLKTSLYTGDSIVKYADADRMMRWLYEMNCISVRSNELPLMDSVLAKSCEYVGETEFEQEIIVIPIGIFDLSFDSVDEQTGLTNGILTKEISIWKDQIPTDSSIVSTHHSSMAGPLFDYFSSDRMGLIIKREFFVSNTKDAEDVIGLTLIRNGVERETEFDQIVLFRPYTDTLQYFQLRVIYSDSAVALFNFMLHTPEIIKEKSMEKWLPQGEEWEDDPDEYASNCSLLEIPWSPGCKDCGMMADSQGNKIKWLYLPAPVKDMTMSNRKSHIFSLRVTGRPCSGRALRKAGKFIAPIMQACCRICADRITTLL